ncbi:hypothetical protein G6F57_015286 [Rhizopus arrhizus]|nr:hypothetical protein G6F22_021426 [Rhizopus arrhizus]KAG1385436.1 hypothetical protein G6F59_017405 [Rhizopus arrhizus]KAG1455499.1 hypothetical protein G6F57_015286 [Rhizopus arrhizus]
MGFHRDHVQRGGPLPVIAPRLPQRQEIQPQAETRLADGEPLAALPAAGQPVAAQKHVLRLPERTGRRMIDIAIHGAIQLAVSVDIDHCGRQGNIRRRHGIPGNNQG